MILLLKQDKLQRWSFDPVLARGFHLGIEWKCIAKEIDELGFKKFTYLIRKHKRFHQMEQISVGDDMENVAERMIFLMTAKAK